MKKLHAEPSGYLGPIVAGLLGAAFIGAWGFVDYGATSQFQEAELRQLADGIYQAYNGQWQDLVDEQKVTHENLSRTLARIAGKEGQVVYAAVLHAEPLGVVSAGPPVAEGFHPPSPLGEGIVAGHYCFWRPLTARDESGRVPPPPFRAGPPAPELFGPTPTLAGRPELPLEAPLLLLAMKMERPPEARKRDFAALFLRIALALLATLGLSVAWGFNIRSRMLSSRLRSESLARSHLEELSLMAAGLAHETKNPLGLVRGLAQQLSARTDISADVQKVAERIVDASDLAVARLGEFLSFARIREVQPAPVPFQTVLDRALDVLGVDLEHSSVTVSNTNTDVWIMADSDMLLQVLLNLLLNSAGASPPGSQVHVSLLAARRDLQLVVTDRGCGMEPNLLANATKPYVSGRPGGHGMGLAIVNRICQLHGWELAIDSTPGSGTTVTISGISPAKPPEAKP